MGVDSSRHIVEVHGGTHDEEGYDVGIWIREDAFERVVVAQRIEAHLNEEDDDASEPAAETQEDENGGLLFGKFEHLKLCNRDDVEHHDRAVVEDVVQSTLSGVPSEGLECYHTRA